MGSQVPPMTTTRPPTLCPSTVLVLAALACDPASPPETTVHNSQRVMEEGGEAASLVIDTVEPALVDPGGRLAAGRARVLGFEPGMTARIAGIQVAVLRVD